MAGAVGRQIQVPAAVLRTLISRLGITLGHGGVQEDTRLPPPYILLSGRKVDAPWALATSSALLVPAAADKQLPASWVPGVGLWKTFRPS